MKNLGGNKKKHHDSQKYYGGMPFGFVFKYKRSIYTTYDYNLIFFYYS